MPINPASRALSVQVAVAGALMTLFLATAGDAAPAAAESARAAPSAGLAPPRIPARGAYLGAWVNPLGLPSLGGASEIPQLALFNKQVTGSVAILHMYVLWGQPVGSDTLREIAKNGSIPMVDVSCANVDQIVSGAWDATIRDLATTLKAFAKPVFLRWYWEMNLNSVAHLSCNGYNRGIKYVAAWRHIATVFHRLGADNVAFIWCPSSHGDAYKYYPGDGYVDWIAADSYDRAHMGGLAFHHAFAHFYGQWAGRGKPLMIGETAATSIDQAIYISTMQQLLPAYYPNIRAVIYFDAPGDFDDWSLKGQGMAAFEALANASYFSPG